MIEGRVVSNGEKLPVANARIQGRFLDSSGFVITAGTSADENGRFVVPNIGRVFTEIRLEARSPNGLGKRVVDLTGPITGVRDLGDVELCQVHTIWFRVITADEVPLMGSVVQALPKGRTLATADESGNGMIESDTPITSLRVLCFGFELTDVPVPPGDDSVVVRLRAAATLTVRVMTVAGEADSSATVRVEATQSPYDVAPHEALWKAAGNSMPIYGPTREVTGGRTFRGTKIRLSPIRPGVPITLVATSTLAEGETRQQVELGPGEHRVVDLVLKGAFGRLKGRVVGPSERPVDGANVVLSRKGAGRVVETTGTTDQNGEFDLGSVPSVPSDLHISCEKYARWQVSDHRVLPDSEPLLIKLEEGVPLSVKVLDAEGAPVKGASVYALDRFAITDGEGQVALSHLPREDIPIQTFFAGVFNTFPHHSATPHAVVRLNPVRR